MRFFENRTEKQNLRVGCYEAVCFLFHANESGPIKMYRSTRDWTFLYPLSLRAALHAPAVRMRIDWMICDDNGDRKGFFCGLFKTAFCIETIQRCMVNLLMNGELKRTCKEVVPGLTYLLMYGAEPFLRSCQLCSHLGNSQQF
jgi:hypothetical protein